MLDLSRNSGTALVPCAPCCHKIKDIYDGIAAVITPSYQDGITFPFVHVGYNYRRPTTVLQADLYPSWGYSTQPLILPLIQTDENVRTYQNSCNVEIPQDNASTDPTTNFIGARFFLKLIVVENISIDVFFSVDGTNWTKQQETFYGEYFSFEITSALQTDWFSDPVVLSSPIKMRITISAGKYFQYPSEYYSKYSEAECYDGIYRRNVVIVETAPGKYGPENGENTVCLEQSFKSYYSKTQVFGKVGSYQPFNTYDIIAGNLNQDCGPIIYPWYGWGVNEFLGTTFISSNPTPIEEPDGKILARVVALVDYRKPVHFVSKPYYFEANVLFWKDYTTNFNSPLAYRKTLLWSSKLVITE